MRGTSTAGRRLPSSCGAPEDIFYGVCSANAAAPHVRFEPNEIDVASRTKGRLHPDHVRQSYDQIVADSLSSALATHAEVIETAKRDFGMRHKESLHAGQTLSSSIG